IRLVGDLVPRREMTRLLVHIEQLQRQNHSAEQAIVPVRTAMTILKRQLDDVVNRLNANGVLAEGGMVETPDLRSITDFKNKLIALENRLDRLSSRQDDSLQQLLDTSALQMQMETLESRLQAAEAQMNSVRRQVDEGLPSMNGSSGAPRYDLVFALKEFHASGTSGEKGSRSILMEALQQTQKHLVVVLPWLDEATFDRTLIQQMQGFLDRKGTIEMGLGHLGNTHRSRQARCLEQPDLMPPARTFLLEALHQLTQLKRRYPKQFKFKILGTDENFLICDQVLAILGMQNIATASPLFPDVEVGLRTRDQRVVQSLWERFQNPTIDPQDVLAYFNRAVTRYELGDKPGAVDDYNQVLQVNPDDDIAYNNRGVAHYELGQKDSALADFAQALQINPMNAVAHANRGFTAAELGDREGALEDYSRAIQINPEFVTAYLYRGVVHTRLGDKQGAITDYTQAIGLKPDLAMAYFYRGLAHTKLNDMQAAIEDLLQAAQFFRDQGLQGHYQKVLDTVMLIFEKGGGTLPLETLNHPLLQQHRVSSAK
ncbi:MAG: tetratricopeptide repeat protein, partial [Leptolyngbyaceae cyanobacterium bins.59]|nr:tetratricopeptide repeat protein [Leptolyngbyaceae cyanobacterium bins.59]